MQCGHFINSNMQCKEAFQKRVIDTQLPNKAAALQILKSR